MQEYGQQSDDKYNVVDMTHTVADLIEILSDFNPELKVHVGTQPVIAVLTADELMNSDPDTVYLLLGSEKGDTK